MKKMLSAVACVALMSAPAIAAPKEAKPVELSAPELTAAQGRTYNVPMSILWPATVSTLQTLGYLNIQASKDAGTISGETESKSKAFYNIIWGFGKKKLTQSASLLLEEMNPTTSTVKLNLSIAETKARGIFGTSFKDGKLVKVGEPYAEFYAALDSEMARRASFAASAAPAVAPAASQ